VVLRGATPVRLVLGASISGSPMNEVLMSPGTWDRWTLEFPRAQLRRPLLELNFLILPAPRARGAHVDRPEVFVDYIEVAAPDGLRLSFTACLLLATVPLGAFAFARLIGFDGSAALVGAAASCLVTVALVRIAPLSMWLAVPRLLPFAFGLGLLLDRFLRRHPPAVAGDRPALCALAVLGVVFHGSLVFYPGHNPPDIDIHARRTLDLADVPLSYDALLRYSSQLPTASQDQGQATAALGERVLIPYSPLPYIVYYALHCVGLDLYWAMTVLNAGLVMAVGPWLFLVAEGLWNRAVAWTALLLYTLDLAVWHHVGRSHAPAVFGGALATSALLYLARHAQGLDSPRRAAFAGAVLGAASLGYSSLVVSLGLFGVVLLTLLALDASDVEVKSRWGLAGALVVGGLLAGCLFYFHYVPGLLRGASGVEAEPDLFPGRTFLIFHNESRQSLRVWQMGYAAPLLAGLLAAPLALRRLSTAPRLVFVAWVASWMLIMILKEPLLFPKLLRWAKEDQFLSPALCLFVAAGVWALPRALRIPSTALVLLSALGIQLRDFMDHLDSVRL